MSGDITSGDPLDDPGKRDDKDAFGNPAAAFAPPTSVPPPASAPAPSGYGSGPVPPGAGGNAPAAGFPAPTPTPAPAGGVAGGPYVLAEWWRRVVAAIVDGLVITIPGIVLAIALFAAFGVGFSDDDGDGAGALAALAALLLAFFAFAIAALLYAPVIMSRTNGRTIGKMVTGCRVVLTSGERMTFGQAALREVVIKSLLFGMIGGTVVVVPFIDWLWPLWDEENRALHDFLARTRVVRA